MSNNNVYQGEEPDFIELDYFRLQFHKLLERLKKLPIREINRLNSQAPNNRHTFPFNPSLEDDPSDTDAIIRRLLALKHRPNLRTTRMDSISLQEIAWDLRQLCMLLSRGPYQGQDIMLVWAWEQERPIMKTAVWAILLYTFLSQQHPEYLAIAALCSLELYFLPFSLMEASTLSSYASHPEFCKTDTMRLLAETQREAEMDNRFSVGYPFTWTLWRAFSQALPSLNHRSDELLFSQTIQKDLNHFERARIAKLYRDILLMGEETMFVGTSVVQSDNRHRGFFEQLLELACLQPPLESLLTCAEIISSRAIDHILSEHLPGNALNFLYRGLDKLLYVIFRSFAVACSDDCNSEPEETHLVLDEAFKLSIRVPHTAYVYLLMIGALTARQQYPAAFRAAIGPYNLTSSSGQRPSQRLRQGQFLQPYIILDHPYSPMPSLILEHLVRNESNVKTLLSDLLREACLTYPCLPCSHLPKFTNQLPIGLCGRCLNLLDMASFFIRNYEEDAVKAWEGLCKPSLSQICRPEMIHWKPLLHTFYRLRIIHHTIKAHTQDFVSISLSIITDIHYAKQ